MRKPSVPSASPWIAKVHFDLLHTRCADAERCLRAVLAVIDPDILTRHAGDWKAASAEVTGAAE